MASGAKDTAEPAGFCGKTAYHHGNLCEALVQASLKILAEEGLAALGLRSAARAAGVSQTAPYHHFGSKEGLLAAVVTEGLRQISAAQRELAGRVAPTDEDPGALFRALGKLYIRFAREHPELFKLMFGGVIQNRDAYPDLIEAYREGYSFIEAATEGFLARMPGDTIPTPLAVVGAWSMVHGLSHLLIDRKVRPGEDDLPDEDTLIDAALQTYARGLRSD